MPASAVCCSTMTSEAPGNLAEMMSQCVLAFKAWRLRGSVSGFGVDVGYLARWVSATNEAVGCCYLLASGDLTRIPLFCAAPQAVALLRALRLYCRGVSSGDRFRWFLAELCASGGAACGGAPKGRYFSSGCRAAPRAAPGSGNSGGTPPNTRSAMHRGVC